MEVTAEHMVQLKCVLMDFGEAYTIIVGMKPTAVFSVNNCLEKRILVSASLWKYEEIEYTKHTSLFLRWQCL